MPRKLKRILVVDGSEVARTLIVRILNEEMPDTEITTCGTVQEACAWLDEDTNRADACELLGSGRYVNAPVDVLEKSLAGTVIRRT